MSDCGTFLRHRDVAASGEEAESREGLGVVAFGEDGAVTLIARGREVRELVSGELVRRSTSSELCTGFPTGRCSPAPQPEVRAQRAQHT